MAGRGSRAADARRALAEILGRPSLVRAELAFGAMVIAELAYTVGLGVLAFEDGGASRLGLVAALRLIPSAVLAPFAAALADRWPRERVLAASSALLAVSTAASAAVLATGGHLLIVYALAVVTTIALTPYRAAHSALLPTLCSTTRELTASNIVRGMVESLSLVVGPLLAAGLIEAGELWTVFAATSATGAAAASLVVGLPYERPPLLAARIRTPLVADAIDGFRSARQNPEARSLMAFAAVQTFLRGCLGVFTVVLAIDVLDTGESGVGLLQAAMGAGAVAGSIGAAQLVGSRRLGAWLGVGVALWGVPICIVGAVPERAFALVMLASIGAANAVLDVALFTMFGRLIADEVLARVFGVFETLVAVTVALGSVAAAAAIELVGFRAAMVTLGSLAPLVIVAGRRRLLRIDNVLAIRQDELDLLQRVPMLRALPVPMIEHLARRLFVRRLRAGETVIRQGTVGTGFYVVAAGQVEVRADGLTLRTMGPGEGFGEISLLQSVRRTATVVAGAGGAVELYCLDRQDFVGAMTGYRPAARAAAEVIDAWPDRA